MPNTLVHKSFCAVEIKDAEKGDVEAIIATLGVVDRDEDIIRPGAIPDGANVSMSSYGHSAAYGDRPVGKGKIHIEGNKAVFRGRVFLKTLEGRETFETLKEMGADQQWSWGFEVLGSEVPTEDEKKQGARRALTKTDTFEVSPVIRGAGIGTRTVGVKSAASVDAGMAITAEAVAAACRACAEVCDGFIVGTVAVADFTAACEACCDACDLSEEDDADDDAPMGDGKAKKPTPEELAARVAAAGTAAMERRFARGLPRGAR